MMRHSLSLGLALVCGFALGAGSTGAADPAPLTVFAASDLTFALKEIAPHFEKATGARVTLVFGSTGNFAHQIRQGGPADVFFAADQSFVDALIAEGVALGETRTLYAQGRIVLVTARAFGAKLTELRGLLDPRVRHIAIANPAHAPYGRAAEQALRKAGLWEALRPKLVFGEKHPHAPAVRPDGRGGGRIVARFRHRRPGSRLGPHRAAMHAPLDRPPPSYAAARDQSWAWHSIPVRQRGRRGAPS